MQSDSDWYKFQEEIKDHFLSIGADAQTNVRIQGVRTSHDVDVFVTSKFLGEKITWIVEAKKWKSKVKKAQVLTLRTIVDDTGADRGFIVGSMGFQKGAIEAADNTNIKLKTFEELKSDTNDYIESVVLKMYKKRLGILEDRYWSHSRSIRIQYGLRHDIFDSRSKFIGQQMLTVARAAIIAAEERNYPIDLETFLEEQKGQSIAENFQQLSNWLNLNLNHFDEKLLLAEWEMHKNGHYNPKTIRTDDNDIPTTELTARAMYNASKNNS